ncbi:cupin domain-containing protein [Nocardiopsis halotolerans]|uniref:cupin domain-containing protein n=1 Tax=Nocardiopsis halotolerans TaxID=124252 RepID=UPI00034A82B3|nr:cupin domain-containing protein [Nocardiopsis halotolerans]
MPEHTLSAYPEWVWRLPEADTSFPGSEGRLISGGTGTSGNGGQVVLWTFEEGGTVPPHAHGPQLGVVLTGGMELTIGNRVLRCGPGDAFEVADGETHSAVLEPGTRVIELFEEGDRHRARA